MPFLYSLALIGMLMMLSFASAYFRKGEGFSVNVFLTAMAIGIGILVWGHILSRYAMIFSVGAIVAILFSDRIYGGKG